MALNEGADKKQEVLATESKVISRFIAIFSENPESTLLIVVFFPYNIEHRKNMH
jgi:hypothetical protein